MLPLVRNQFVYGRLAVAPVWLDARFDLHSSNSRTNARKSVFCIVVSSTLKLGIPIKQPACQNLNRGINQSSCSAQKRRLSAVAWHSTPMTLLDAMGAKITLTTWDNLLDIAAESDLSDGVVHR